MRTGGFPCRLVGCVRTFQVLDQRSMSSLHAASAARSEHEVADHDYHHVELAEQRPYLTPRIKPKPRPGVA